MAISPWGWDVGFGRVLSGAIHGIHLYTLHVRVVEPRDIGLGAPMVDANTFMARACKLWKYTEGN